MLRWILRKAAPIPALESFQRFLFIGPHPDDIEIGAGATAAKLARAGRTVKFLIATDGRYGLANAPDGTTAEKLIEIRKEEALASAAKLGVHDVEFLGLSDGGQYEIQDLKNAIARAVGAFQPDVILAPDPWVSSECHKDHICVGEAAREIAFFSPFKEIAACYGARSAPVKALAYFMTARPSQYVKTGKLINVQLDSIFSCHTSQFPPGSAEAASFPRYLMLRSLMFGLRRGCLHAEGFRMLDQTHMHCMPEAGR
ncbi:MAG: PIG-L family deacetylase [Sphaerochaetaceae bacterium]|jgi:LmbE family N-acetylglucosaminyl deacetylase|nr:PIG-L family deacetylase [Sphaerochaetaceae bacterium]MDD4007072.1 PIG-L family deacetylase [Sphaerochaetaceae bacterium]MDD4396903.1 PIG-L family deacetylase [Sphaerochaetaceae bacterium]